MAKTANDVIVLAQQSINDPLGTRFTPTLYLRACNRALERLFTERPDLFVGSLAAAPTPLATIGSTVPYEDQFAQLHADMLVADLEFVGDEEANGARGKVFDDRAHR
jgi:hypothetical protein